MFEAFSAGPFIIWTRTIFLLLGIWLSFEFFLRLAKSAHLSLQHFRDRAWMYALAFLLGGRLIAMLLDYQVYKKDLLRMFVVWDGGFSYLGGAIGIGIMLYWITRQHRTTFLQWLDVLLPAASFGLVFDWLGKFTAGQSYGHLTDMFWGVTYEAMHVRYVAPVQPVQLFYALFFLLLTFLLLVIRKNAHRAGSETLFGIVLASVATFFLEYLRGDFSIPVYATQLDFVVLFLLFASLGIFAAVELRLSQLQVYLYELLLVLFVIGYMLLRSWLEFPTMELRFSQFLSVLALLGTVVYVIVHRRKYPHL
ncbi:MAG: prolipoprotein diacylglyceryl transferase [Candidatus Peribacteraceae bacterium]|nr:prolipoprotein diacylglyceryl transferase [Candidatus Peribacteraceae bacterium]